MIMHLKEFGSVLCTRQSGRLANNAAMASLAQGDHVEFDFDGVESVTNSFADELFGRLALELGMDKLKSAMSFSHVNRSSARFILSVMERRSTAAVV